MKKLLFIAGVCGAIALPALAQSREITITTQLNNFRGDGAYLVVYLTDFEGKYLQTLWIAGKKSKHYRHLSDWALGSNRSRSEYDGLTGASISPGQMLQITANLDDSLIDSGYQLRLDSAVEDMNDHPADIIASLTNAGAGIPIHGTGYVYTMTYDIEDPLENK